MEGRAASRSGLGRFVAVAAGLWLGGSASAAPAPGAPAAGPTTPAANTAGDVQMALVPSGVTEKLGGYRPQQAKLAKAKPAAVKKAPEMTAPLYGQITFGGKSYAVALDEPENGDAKLYVDSNGNGDLTDDPATKWEKKTGNGPNGVQLTQYSGTFQLPLGAPKAAAKGAEKEPDKDAEPDAKPAAGPGAAAADSPGLVTLSAYRFDPKDPQRAALKTTLMYYADYGYEGDVTLGGAKYHALLVDMSALGQFVAKPAAANGAGGGAMLLIDINNDKAFTQHGEAFDAAKPFNVRGTTWALSFPGDGGAPFKVAQSNVKVAEIPLPPGVGGKATPFQARRMDGKAVKFPDDYKGKLVMLDFWATWCPPCRAEIPGLVSAYNQYHPKGIEILGISLDQPKAADEIKTMMTKEGMTWPQVYDGKFWKAATAELYGIQSIPAAFLVDGDTGLIVAAGGSLRGDNLEKTFEAALEKKKPQPGTAKADDKPAEKPDDSAATEAKAATPAEPAAPAKPDAAEPKPEKANQEKPAKKDALPF